LALAKRSSLVATGELALKPAIHVWDSSTLQNVGIIKGTHRNGVHLLTFFKNDELLATCGIREDSPVLVYGVRDLNLVLSTFVSEMAIELTTIANFTHDTGNERHSTSD
jgi:microtubule-associated protein-like 5